MPRSRPGPRRRRPLPASSAPASIVCDAVPRPDDPGVGAGGDLRPDRARAHAGLRPAAHPARGARGALHDGRLRRRHRDQRDRQPRAGAGGGDGGGRRHRRRHLPLRLQAAAGQAAAGGAHGLDRALHRGRGGLPPDLRRLRPLLHRSAPANPRRGPARHLPLPCAHRGGGAGGGDHRPAGVALGIDPDGDFLAGHGLGSAGGGELRRRRREGALPQLLHRLGARRRGRDDGRAPEQPRRADHGRGARVQGAGHHRAGGGSAPPAARWPPRSRSG